MQTNTDLRSICVFAVGNDVVIELCPTFVYRWLLPSQKKSQTKELRAHYQSVVLVWLILAFLLDFYFKMNKSMNPKVFKYLLYLFLIGLGIIIGVAIRHYYNIPISETINIIDVAALVTTIFLSVYIPGVLDRQLQTKRDKKELIVQRIEELQALYRKINILVQQENINVKDNIIIRNTLDICQHRLDTIITLLNLSAMKTSFTHEINEIKNLSKEHKELLLNNKTDEYSVEIQEKEELLYNDIDKSTSLLILKLSDI